MRRWLAITGVGLAALGVVTASVGAQPGVSRIIDRTFSCEAGFVGGLYQVTLRSSYSTAPGSSKLRVSSGVALGIYQSLASLGSDGFTLHRGYCAPSQSAVKLTTKGLRGGAVPPLGTESTCETPRRLLLRVRAVFERPVSPHVSRQFGFPQLIATGDLELAALAVGTRTGKTIAYLTVTGTEKARLYTSKTCKED